MGLYLQMFHANSADLFAGSSRNESIHNKFVRKPFAREVKKLKEHKASVADEKDVYTGKTCMSQQIKITVHLPKNISEDARRQKINRIYDILNPKTSQ